MPVVVVSAAVVVVTVESVEASPGAAVVWSAGGAGAGVVVAELAGASVASLPAVAGGASVGPPGWAVEPPEKVMFLGKNVDANRYHRVRTSRFFSEGQTNVIFKKLD